MDPFHACALLLIYNKDYCRTKKAGDAKFDYLLNHYNLMERVVSDENSINKLLKTNYEKVNKQLEEDRADLLHFL